jgi:chromosome segregation ATPase
MSDDFETRLSAAAQAMRELEVTQQRRDDLCARQDQIRAEVKALRASYSAEQETVDRLEHLSFARIASSLHGSREQTLERERAEADAIRYRIADALARLDAVHQQIGSAEGRLTELNSAPDAYAAVLEAKERDLTSSGDPRRATLLSLADERGRLDGEVAEMNKALDDAGSAQMALMVVQTTLASARSANTADLFFRGGVSGLMVDVEEHARLDRAAQQAADADRRMSVLRTELTNLDQATDTSPLISISNATKFVDMWFGNIFTDLAVRDRITQGQQNVDHSLQLVNEVQQQLNARIAAARARLAQIEAQRRDLLTQ